MLKTEPVVEADGARVVVFRAQIEARRAIAEHGLRDTKRQRGTNALPSRRFTHGKCS